MLFLLSVDEYRKYRDNIPQINLWWWTRDRYPGIETNVEIVSANGDFCPYGDRFDNPYNGVRPALRDPNTSESTNRIGDRKIYFDFPFLYVGDDVWIAEMPIAISFFNENEECDYNDSDIKKFLEEWEKSR